MATAMATATATAMATLVVLSGCGAARPIVDATPAWVGAPYAPGPDGKRPPVPELEALGRALFFDPSLSASGKTACASCHDARFAYGPPNALPVQLAGLDGRTPGLRAVPSLRYLQSLPAFTEHDFDDDGDDSVDRGPTGGHTWDGRAGSAHEQARLPLLSEMEMANAMPSAVAGGIARGVHAVAFRRVFGDAVFDQPDHAFAAAAMSLEVFLQSPREFAPYSSKFDAVLRGEASLDARESRGLRWFDDPAKGNCASCHPSTRASNGAFPLFTDFGMVGLGLPRNPQIPANRDPEFFDLGLCGPLRIDLASHGSDCGLFRAPSLRNVATRRSFFHNGVFHALRDAVAFYAWRDVRPERLYPRGAAGELLRFDDLPARYRANVNVEAPFDRRPGEPASLSDSEIDDVVAFLCTLTDADVKAQASVACGGDQPATAESAHVVR